MVILISKLSIRNSLKITRLAVAKQKQIEYEYNIHFNMVK